jgi:hypothetical protein
VLGLQTEFRIPVAVPKTWRVVQLLSPRYTGQFGPGKVVTKAAKVITSSNDPKIKLPGVSTRNGPLPRRRRSLSVQFLPFGVVTLLSTADPWVFDQEDPRFFERIPPEWVQTDNAGRETLLPNRQDWIPERLEVHPDGKIGPDGIEAAFIEAPFRFCLAGGVSYDVRKNSRDFDRVAGIGGEGHSSATTILSLSTHKYLKSTDGISETARKLLAFSDNRQDAALQTTVVNSPGFQKSSGGAVTEWLLPGLREAPDK